MISRQQMAWHRVIPFGVALLVLAVPVWSQKQTKPSPVQKPRKDKQQRDYLVAYDSHDHRYYLLTWARAHRMRDPGGDPLRVMLLSKLPAGTNPAVVPLSNR